MNFFSILYFKSINPLATTSQNRQTHSNNSSVFVDELLGVFDHFVELPLKRLNITCIPVEIIYNSLRKNDSIHLMLKMLLNT